MAKVEDAKIEEVLRQTVCRLAAKDEEVTPSDVRSRTEKKLGLEEGFLVGDAWKKRSKSIIIDAFQTLEEDATQGSNKKATDSLAVDSSKPKQNGTKVKKDDLKEKSALNLSQSKAANAHSPSVQPTPKRPEGTPAKINGVKRKASDQSSSDEKSSKLRSDSETSVAGDASPQKKQKTESSSGSGESSDKDSSEDEFVSASSPESDAEPEADVHDVAEAIPSTQYKPPAGFTDADPSQLGQKSLMLPQDKQIWHLTAPSGLSLSSLQEFALSAITSHEPVLRHNDVDYVMKEDENPANVDATVFERTRDGYKSTKRKVDRRLQLQPRLVLPNLSAKQASQVTGSSAAADIAEPSVSTVRPQPKGLRMTYRPPGYGPGKLGAIGSGSESTDEDEQPRPSFQFFKTLGGHGTKKQQIGERDVDMVDADTMAAAVKSKKKRKDESQASSQGAQVNGIAGSSPPLPNGMHLSPEDEKAAKAKRKEEKRLKKERKEAKRKAREASQ